MEKLTKEDKERQKTINGIIDLLNEHHPYEQMRILAELQHTLSEVMEEMQNEQWGKE